MGVVLYGALWLLLPLDEDAPAPEPGSRRDNVAALAVVAGLMLVLRSAGLWFSDTIAVIGGVAAVGIALVWGRAGGTASVVEDRRTLLRVVVGVVLVITGFLAFVALAGDLRGLAQSLVAAAVAAAGVALLAGPRLARLADDLATERRARVRSEERAEIAAHLHDGVLQTLTLIQRRADDPREVTALARRQERELREWLYGSRSSGHRTLTGALADELGAVEDDHHVRVEVVCVGDAPLDDPARALVAAAREAATNAARHAGVDRVDVYVEVEDDEIVAFVRDRGRGFDRETVPADRKGLEESVEGRLRRAGGAASVRSTPGSGTEVTMRIPRSSA
jgi:signal transduction histidine kinase